MATPSHLALWGTGALALLLAVALGLWFVVFPTPRFATPTGPHGIGTQLYEWTDATRPEPFTADAADRRRLVVEVWYPSVDRGPAQPYMADGAVLAAIAGRLHLPAALLGRLKDAPTHGVRGGRPEAGRYPVLINPTGFSGFRDASLFWIEELVSHGYVVVTLDQPGTSAATVFEDGGVVPVMADKAEFDRYMPLALSAGGPAPDMNGVALPGGIIPFLAADLSFVLDRLVEANDGDPALNGLLDLDRVGVFGMSLGGYIGPEACRLDSRFKACLTVDAGKTAPVAEAGLAQPVMIISRDAEVMREERAKAGGWPEPEIVHTIGDQRALFEHTRGDAYYVTMDGMYHVNWTDAPVWSPLLGWMGLAGPIDPYEGFTLSNDCAVSFFDKYLKELDGPVCGLAAGRTDMRVEARVR